MKINQFLFLIDETITNEHNSEIFHHLILIGCAQKLSEERMKK